MKAMPAILACTDGSIYAPSIYQLTAWAAQRLAASVEVLHVLDHHRERAASIDFSGSIGIDASLHLTEELTKFEEEQGRIARLKGKAILEDARQQLAATGIANVTTTQRHGTLVDTLDELEPRCDLVVIGKRGEHADFAKGHLGGNLQRVIRAAVRPVLVAARAFRPIERFLIASDGGPSATKAIDFALASPLLKGAACHILRAGHVDDRAKWYLEEAAGKLRAGGSEVTSHAVSGEPVTVIAETVKREDIQLLVMGAYGHSPIRTLILGSTTTTMVRTCLVPVLMFR
ncbi:MAG: universal stress protein [Chthoniobacter sp.]|uniref:universal stress protein n=1 Tax=Chthoniobacter sp. TaxID=2510640 RepID=UPI0032A1D506